MIEKPATTYVVSVFVELDGQTVLTTLDGQTVLTTSDKQAPLDLPKEIGDKVRIETMMPKPETP